MEHTDTIIALATPPGRSAIAVIRLSGPDSIALVDTAFPSKDLHSVPGHTLHFGGLYDSCDQLVDEVLLSVFRGPRSYTGENAVEISCHGSPLIVRQIMQFFIQRGARPAQAGEFTKRAFLHGRMDLSQAEAVADVIASESQAAKDVALRQLRQGVGHQLTDLRNKLIHFAGLIELELDFSEEDVEFANRNDLLALIQEILSVIEELRMSFAWGNAIKHGIQTVIAGRPNAGKSTLLNALLNEERAIVSDIPGTTRDTIEEILYIDNLAFRLVDTAGIRQAQDAIEEVGVSRTLQKISEAALLVYVFDVVQTTPSEVASDLKKLVRPDLPYLVVANKMDQEPYAKVDHYPEVPTKAFVPISALSKMNLQLLREKLVEMILPQQMPDIAPLTNARHYASLNAAHHDLNMALEGLKHGQPGDLIATDIRMATRHLGEITGTISTDDLLDRIFSEFCIGK